MKIAILGWGSIIWDKCELNIKHDWQKDGPLLPIEFARISRDGRLTLAIKENSTPVQVLWNIMDLNSLAKARENLRVREGAYSPKAIGYVDLIHGNQLSRIELVVPVIKEWATKENMDAVIWTDLGVNFEDRYEKKLSIDTIVSYLNKLPTEIQENAKEYIINAPVQIQTDYRKKIQKRLNWENDYLL